MVEGKPNLVLPFAVIEGAGGRADEFPKEMTLATVLADVERQRSKGGVLRRREEVLESASLLYWPIVIAPWRKNRHLVFDGMGVWSHVFSHGRVPDARSFTAAVDAATDHEALGGLLRKQASYFDAFSATDRLAVMGLFIHEEFMQDVLAHVALAKPRELEGASLLSPRISEAEARESVRRMQSLIDALRKDLDILAATLKALERARGRGRTELAGLREAATRTHGKKLEQLQPDVNAKVAQLERDREARWTAMQPKLLDLQAEARRAAADLAQLEAEARRKGDTAAAARAKARRGAARAESERAHSRAQKYQEEMARVRLSFDRQIQDQWDRIRALERERDEEIGRLNREERTVAGLVTKLSHSIAGLSRKHQQAVSFLASQGVAAAVKDVVSVLMPIMVASLTSDRGRRVLIYPPMVARAGKGVLGGLRSTFGGAVLPLEPKTEHFDAVFREGIEKALADDASLATYVTSVGNTNNLLHRPDLKQMLSRGLAELKSQGWIKDRHERELIESLERHISAAARTAPRGG